MKDDKPARRIMRRFRINEISTVDRPAQQGALMTLTKAATAKAARAKLKLKDEHVMLKSSMPSKLFGKRRFYAEDFAYAPDERDSSTWRLRLTEKSGEFAPKLVDAAVKAVDAAMQGKAPQRYAIPDDALESVLDKLREAWSAAYPDMSATEMPAPINPDDTPDPEPDPVVDPNAPADDTTDPNADDPTATADPTAVDPNVADPKKKPKPKGKKPSFATKSLDLADEVLKRYVDPAEGAKTFTEVLSICDEDRRYSEVMEAAWPLVSALDTSLRSIIADRNLDEAAKQNMLRSSVEGFLVGVREAMPEVEEALEKALALAAKEYDMTTKVTTAAGAASSVAELAKKVEDLTKALGDEKTAREAAVAELALTKQLGAMDGDERTHYGKCKTDEEKATFLKMEKAERVSTIEKARKADETIVVEGINITKSAVGDGVFAVLKASNARQAKLEDDFKKERETRENIELSKRATDELGHLPGKIEDKVALLKHLDTMPEAGREAAKQMFTAANKTASLAFQNLGSRGGVQKQAATGSNDFQKRISEVRNTEKCSHQEALRKAREQYPEEFAAWQGSN